MQTINPKEHVAKFSGHWNPPVIGEVKDCAVKVVKLKGEFVWHHHDNEDELFLVVKRPLHMKFSDHQRIIPEGEFIMVARGSAQRPVADKEVHWVLIEPKLTLNTGNIINERTVSKLERL